MGLGLPIDAGIESHASREISSFWSSFCSASFSNSADSPPQKMSASGLPFHSTTRPYAIGVPAGIALTFTTTLKRSFAYSAKAFRAASWMNFETGVISVSSPSMGAWAAAIPTALSAIAIASRTVPNRRIHRLLIYVRPGPLRLSPVSRSLDRAAPAFVTTTARGGIHRGFERSLDARPRGQRIERAPEAGAHAGQIRRAQPRRLRHRRSHHGDVENIRLELAEEVVRGGAAIDAQPAHGDPGVGGHRLDDVTALIRDRLQRRTREMRGGRAPRKPDDGATRPPVPVGRAQSHERGHEIDPAGVRHRFSETLALARRADDAEAVAQPLDGGSADEDAPLQRVRDPSVESPRDRREQSVARGDRRLAGVEQQEAAGAVRILGVAGGVARLAEQRRLLIAGDAGDGYAVGQPAEPARLTEDVSRRTHHGEQRSRNTEDAQHLVVPVARAQVETERSRGVRGVGRVDLAAGEPPQEPTVHRPEREVTSLGALAGARHLVEQPADLRAREVGVQDETGPLADARLEAGGAEALAERRRSATLPHDGRMDRRAGSPIPDDRGLALVGDPDRGHIGSAHASLGQRGGRRLLHRGPDFLGVVLHPARPRIVLRQLRIAAGHHASLDVDNERRGTRRSLVERKEDDSRHGRTRRSATSGRSLMTTSTPRSITRRMSDSSLTVHAPTVRRAARVAATRSASSSRKS